jgi:PAS domain S-box-containing protein
MLLKILKNRIILSIVAVATLMLVSLYIFIPKVTEQNLIDLVIKNSKTMVEQIKLTRGYYVKEVVGDVKEYAPNISFDYEHAGVDGKLAFPTSLIHELSDIYTKNTGVTIRLYSDFPFKPKASRVLSDVQKEALREVEKSEEGVWIKRDTINGKEVLRVAVVDFMTQQACVSCHNTHADRTWEEGKWRLGDKRGVLEVITPLDENLEANLHMKHKILILIFISMLILVAFYSFSLVKREKELEDINDDLEHIVEDQTKQIKKNLEIMGQYIIYSKTDLNGVITEVSDAFCKISQYTKEELIGQNHSIVRHADMPKAVFQEMWRTIKNKQVWQGEVKNLKKDGSYYWISTTITPEYDHEGKNVIGYLAVRQDITSEKELEANTKKLYEAEKLASLGEMIGNIAHQWRQPLSALSSTASSIKVENELGLLTSDDINKKMDLIVNKTNFLSETINTFRNFLKSDKSYKNLILENEIQDALNVVSSTLQNNNIDLQNMIPNGQSTEIEMVSGELPQVMVNIVNNAKDVLLEKNVLNPWIKLDLSKNENGKHIITIEDNGGGIPDSVMPKIFDPYFTTKHQSQGTGLGLHMSYKIITDSLHGKLYVKNTDNGAKFYIEL